MSKNYFSYAKFSFVVGRLLFVVRSIDFGHRFKNRIKHKSVIEFDGTNNIRRTANNQEIKPFVERTQIVYSSFVFLEIIN